MNKFNKLFEDLSGTSTPETDALSDKLWDGIKTEHDQLLDMTDFARRLERERNHAKEGLARAGLIIAQIQKDADEIERDRDKVKAEVARLRVELDKYRGQVNRFGAESASEALAAVRGEKAGK